MYKIAGRLGTVSLMAVMPLESCGGRTMGTTPSHAGNTVPSAMSVKPKSVSPALVAAPLSRRTG